MERLIILSAIEHIWENVDIHLNKDELFGKKMVEIIANLMRDADSMGQMIKKPVLPISSYIRLAEFRWASKCSGAKFYIEYWSQFNELMNEEIAKNKVDEAVYAIDIRDHIGC